jgi:hypothetical protein
VFNNRFGNGQLEKDYADFTYRDDDGKLGQYLARRTPGCSAPPLGHGQKITYHLEVKTTLGGLDTRVLLSNNQIQMAKKNSQRLMPNYSNHTDTYVLVRVYDLAIGAGEPKPKFRLYVDPWDLICQNLLRIEGETGIYVRPPNEAPASDPS